MKNLPLILILFGSSLVHSSTNVDRGVDKGSNDQTTDPVKIVKCCEVDELLVDNLCTPLSKSNDSHTWKPEFIPDDDIVNSKVKTIKGPNYELKIGSPRCQSNERQWPVYSSVQDRLVFLPSGKLRHITHSPVDQEDIQSEMHYDYSFGQYCADKAIHTTDNKDNSIATFAKVCVPEVTVRWSDTSYLMKHAIDPTFHAISIVCYLIVAIVYFILPQLRDLVGNMITSMTLCLIANQCASIVGIFTEFGNHISFMIADLVKYISLLAAFFWLNVLGYYVWSTFRSRNIFLRVTDRRKYCYYSSYVWGVTVTIAATAIFAHFALETNKSLIGGTIYPVQETVGWLGTSVLFVSVAFTIIVDLCFVLTTSNTIKRMNTYGRIHHKMKYSFRMFVLVYIIMTIGWISLLMSQLGYEVLTFCHIVINLLQALLILYVCIFAQKRVTFLLGKTCNCCTSNENVEGLDWGEEMTAINAGY